jgi:hypothetical protein
MEGGSVVLDPVSKDDGRVSQQGLKISRGGSTPSLTDQKVQLTNVINIPSIHVLGSLALPGGLRDFNVLDILSDSLTDKLNLLLPGHGNTIIQSVRLTVVTLVCERDAHRLTNILGSDLGHLLASVTARSIDRTRFDTASLPQDVGVEERGTDVSPLGEGGLDDQLTGSLLLGHTQRRGLAGANGRHVDAVLDAVLLGGIVRPTRGKIEHLNREWLDQGKLVSTCQGGITTGNTEGGGEPFSSQHWVKFDALTIENKLKRTHKDP